MRTVEFVRESLGVSRELLLATSDGLSQEQLVWRPQPWANHIGFYLWHLGRVEDNWIRRFILRQAEVWDEEGWYQRLGMDQRALGFGFTPQQVGELPVPPLGELVAYLQRVRERTLEYLETLSEGQLTQVPRPDRRPGFSIAHVLLTLVGHENQHAAEIGYIRGLMAEPVF